jgi:hypothetical protein
VKTISAFAGPAKIIQKETIASAKPRKSIMGMSMLKKTSARDFLNNVSTNDMRD